MSRNRGQTGDEAKTGRGTVRLVATVTVVVALALSIPVGYAAVDTVPGAAKLTTNDHAIAQETPQTYTVQQGETCVEVAPLTSDESVREFYDYRTPYPENEYSNATGFSYSSEGTIDLQEPNSTVMFLHRNGTGILSLVVVHGALDNNASAGGSATWNVSGLPEDGTWAVKDDEYDDGDLYDNWSHGDGTTSIDWTWNGSRTDGLAFEGLGEEFTVTIDPAYNGDARLYQEYYNGTLENWTVLSNDSENHEWAELNHTHDRIALNLTDNVTISTEGCLDGGGATTPEAADENATDEPEVEEPATEEPETAEPETEEPATEAPETEAPATEEPATEEPEAELEGIDLSIASEEILRGETTQVAVTATYADDTEEDVTGAASISTGDNFIATVIGSTITGVNPGETEVTAEFEGETDSETLTVETRGDSAPQATIAGWNRVGSGEFDIEWSATDEDGNLDEVTVELRSGGSVVASADTGASGEFQSGTTSISAEGADAARVVVTDGDSNQDDATLSIGPPPTSEQTDTPEQDETDTPEAAETDTSEPTETETPEPEETDTTEPEQTDTPEDTETPEPEET